MNATLFTNVTILDGTGSSPYPGELLIEGNRVRAVSKGRFGAGRPNADVIDGAGCTLMPGLTDAHTHFTWTNGTLEETGRIPVEEHTLAAMANARLYLDCGYTSCVGAAAAKPRLDVVIRDAINQGKIPGPRYLANGPEIEATGGMGCSFVQVVDGVDEMRRCVRRLLREGVDLIKLNLSGEELIPMARAEYTIMSDEEVAVAVDEAHRRGVRVCAHARSAESVKMCVRHGIEIIYHASFADEEGLDMLEANKERLFVAPAVNWLYTTAYEASDFGITTDMADRYKRELDHAIHGMKKMHERGIRVLPGGDYGFLWCPHGTYARDLEHFVKLFAFTPMETILAATKHGGEIMGAPAELGQLKDGYYADLLLIDGNPLEDITILQDRGNIRAIVKDGVFHKQFDRNGLRQAA